jgi:hypothetical protein
MSQESQPVNQPNLEGLPEGVQVINAPEGLPNIPGVRSLGKLAPGQDLASFVRGFQMPQTETIDGMLWHVLPHFKWGQTVHDIQLIVKFPVGTRGRDIDCKITASTFRFGLKGQPPMFDGELDMMCKPAESTWNIDPQTGEVLVSLQKASKQETWKSVIKGVFAIDPVTQEEMGKKMLLERFTAEVRIHFN